MWHLLNYWCSFNILQFYLPFSIATQHLFLSSWTLFCLSASCVVNKTLINLTLCLNCILSSLSAHRSRQLLFQLQLKKNIFWARKIELKINKFKSSQKYFLFKINKIYFQSCKKLFFQEEIYLILQSIVFQYNMGTDVGCKSYCFAFCSSTSVDADALCLNLATSSADGLALDGDFEMLRQQSGIVWIVLFKWFQPNVFLFCSAVDDPVMETVDEGKVLWCWLLTPWSSVSKQPRVTTFCKRWEVSSLQVGAPKPWEVDKLKEEYGERVIWLRADKYGRKGPWKVWIWRKGKQRAVAAIVWAGELLVPVRSADLE